MEQARIVCETPLTQLDSEALAPVDLEPAELALVGGGVYCVSFD